MEEGIPLRAIKSGIQEFSGVGRRYEKHDLIINEKNITLIDDYGIILLKLSQTLMHTKKNIQIRKFA